MAGALYTINYMTNLYLSVIWAEACGVDFLSIGDKYAFSRGMFEELVVI